MRTGKGGHSIAWSFMQVDAVLMDPNKTNGISQDNIGELNEVTERNDVQELSAENSRIIKSNS